MSFWYTDGTISVENGQAASPTRSSAASLVDPEALEDAIETACAVDPLGR